MKKIENDEIQGVILEILVYFDKICRENNLKYALCGGTLLGAIRHGGFIPWDNDADVVMDRHSYNKFINIMEKDYSKFKLFCCETNNDYFYPYAKLINTHTVLIEDHVKPIKNYGVYLDIFPIDGVPFDKKTRKKFLHNLLSRQKHLMFFCYEYKTFLGKLFGKTVSKFVNLHNKAEKINSLCQTYPLAQNEFWGWPCWSSHYYPKNTIEELVEHSFCGHNFFIPKDYDQVLRLQYGDYMTLPPKNKQVAHVIKAFYK